MHFWFLLDIGHHSASVAAAVSLLIIIGIIILLSGVKNRNILSYFKEKVVFVSIGLLISALIVDYGYSSIFKNKDHEYANLGHNFSIQFPTSPKITKFKPNPNAGVIGGCHFLSENGIGAFMVIYTEYFNSIFEHHSDQEIIEASLKAIPVKLNFEATNRIKSDVQGFSGYKFYAQQGDKIIGKGLVCSVYNRIYFVVFIKKQSIVDEKIIDAYIDSFKILDVDLKNRRT